MSETRKIKSALISVFSKDGLDELALELHRQGVQIYSTGGTQVFLENFMKTRKGSKLFIQKFLVAF